MTPAGAAETAGDKQESYHEVVAEPWDNQSQDEVVLMPQPRNAEEEERSRRYQESIKMKTYTFDQLSPAQSELEFRQPRRPVPISLNQSMSLHSEEERKSLGGGFVVSPSAASKGPETQALVKGKRLI